MDQVHRGLLCRLPADQGVCREVFLPDEDTVIAIGVAGLTRDRHESAAHGYVHIVTTDFKGNYTDSLSSRGRSTLGKRLIDPHVRFHSG